MAAPDLQPLRAALGEPKRKLGWFTDPPIAMVKPSFFDDVSASQDPVVGLFSDLKEVWKHGKVVWGRVLKAHQDIYQPGEEGRVGEIIYSLTASDEEAWRLLNGFHERLWMLADNEDDDPTKLTQREREWTEDMLNDAVYHAGFKLPETWVPEGQEYRASTLYFHRPHLPERRITHRLLPILALPWAPFWAVVVPVSDWPAELREALAKEAARPSKPTAPRPCCSVSRPPE